MEEGWYGGDSEPLSSADVPFVAPFEGSTALAAMLLSTAMVATMAGTTDVGEDVLARNATSLRNATSVEETVEGTVEGTEAFFVGGGPSMTSMVASLVPSMLALEFGSTGERGRLLLLAFLFIVITWKK